MKAMVYTAPGAMEMRDLEVQQPKAGEVRIRVKATGICGSDLHGYLGQTGRRIPPMVMGHEFSGVVEALGEGVGQLSVGDRVAGYPIDYCGHCGPCLRGEEHLCVHRRQFGVLSVNGAFAETICIPAKCCYRLADQVSFEVGTVMEPLSVALRAVRKGGDLKDRDVMIVGGGTVGLLALACIVPQKPRTVTVCDLSASRLEIAREMGATHTIRADAEDAAARANEITNGKGMDVTYEACGASPTAATSIACLRVGGTAVWIGNNIPMVTINMQQLVTRELKVYGSFLYSPAEFRAAVDMINQGVVNVAPIINRVEPFDKGCEIFAELSENLGTTLKCVLVQ